MSTVKALRFPVSVRWNGGRLTTASAPARDAVEVATPPEFAGGLGGYWSPEELLVSACASCYALTFAAVVERREIPIHELRVHGTGHISKRDDGRFGFVAVELDADVVTPAASVRAAEGAAEWAKQVCIVSQALNIPVHVMTVVRTDAPAHELLGSGVAS